MGKEITVIFILGKKSVQSFSRKKSVSTTYKVVITYAIFQK